jgi:hypothetical protein
MMSMPLDALNDLLPAYVRLRDTDIGEPLRALLAIISEQFGHVEADLERWYNNWFIETCEDWVVPYLGDLLGVVPVGRVVDTGGLDPASLRLLREVESPRAEIADALRFRRRKGTLAVLEELAFAVTGRRGVAVEFRNHLSQTQDLRHVRTEIGRRSHLRNGDALELLFSPFDTSARSVDVRRINSTRTPGRFGVRTVGLFIFPWQVYSATQSPALRVSGATEHHFTLDPLGRDTPLFNRPRDPAEQPPVVGERAAPVPIRARALAADLPPVRTGEYREPGRRLQLPDVIDNPAVTAEDEESFYFGPAGSIRLTWRQVGDGASRAPARSVPLSQIVVGDLSNWERAANLPAEKIILDPRRGRVAFPPQMAIASVFSSYWYGLTGDIGGGEYRRAVTDPSKPNFYRVVSNPRRSLMEFATLDAAVAQYQRDCRAGVIHKNAVIEIERRGICKLNRSVEIPPDKSLQIRAAPGVRALLRISDSPAPHFHGGENSVLTLDGLTTFGASLRIAGGFDLVRVRHCSLSSCRVPKTCITASFGLFLEFHGPRTRVEVVSSILGPCKLRRSAAVADPIIIDVRDSIWDAGELGGSALHADDCGFASATLIAARVTFLGTVKTHAASADNSIFNAPLIVARRQAGCLRFCFVAPGSRTPPRYHCVPDLAAEPPLDDSIRPAFVSTQYGAPGYARLTDDCPVAIRRGAEDQSEMGAFHDQFLPQRLIDLQARLEEFIPASASAGVLTARIAATPEH